MARVLRTLSMAVLGIIILANAALAAEKFGYVSINRIGEAYQKTKDYMKKLEDKGTQYGNEIDKKRNEVKQFQDKINLLSDKEKETKNVELENKIKALQDFVREKETDLRKDEVDRTIEISKDIKAAIDKFSEKEGYTILFEAAALAYQPKNMDATDKIIEILNKEYKK